MPRDNHEKDQPQLLPRLLLVGGVGAAALSGVMYEAANGNLKGASAFIVAGLFGMGGIGVVLERKNNHDAN